MGTEVFIFSPICDAEEMEHSINYKSNIKIGE